MHCGSRHWASDGRTLSARHRFQLGSFHFDNQATFTRGADKGNNPSLRIPTFVANLRSGATHEVVEQALTALRNLDHRGAVGAEVDSGDGAGILLQVPDAFLRAVWAEQGDPSGVELPPAGQYAVGLGFLPDDDADVGGGFLPPADDSISRSAPPPPHWQTSASRQL